MTPRIPLVVCGLLAAGWIARAGAQETGMPSYNAPYRAFASHEFGGTLSFPEGEGLALEGQYKFGTRTWDIGIRGGFFDPDGPGDTRILLGASFRNRVITHSPDFPLDGAVILGAGAQLVSDQSVLIIPGGLSLGRRLNVEDSEVSIVPYVQPTVFLTFADRPATGLDTELNFALGLGGDFRLSRHFDARISIGLGDVEGIALSAVWIR
jgi:hypothetical protein